MPTSRISPLTHRTTANNCPGQSLRTSEQQLRRSFLCCPLWGKWPGWDAAHIRCLCDGFGRMLSPLGKVARRAERGICRQGRQRQVKDGLSTQKRMVYIGRGRQQEQMPLQSLARQLSQRGRHAHPLLARRFRESAVPFGESGPQGRKGKLQAMGVAKGERWLKHANEDGLHRAGSSARADTPSVAGATAFPEGTPRTSVANARFLRRD